MTDYFDPGREREFYTYISHSQSSRETIQSPQTHASSMQILRRLSRNLGLRPAFHRPVRCRGGREA
jgi:hypothetical protein